MLSMLLLDKVLYGQFHSNRVACCAKFILYLQFLESQHKASLVCSALSIVIRSSSIHNGKILFSDLYLPGKSRTKAGNGHTLGLLR